MVASSASRSVNWLLKRLLQIRMVRHNVATSPELRLNRLMNTEGIDLVVDVGANAGQFACDLRRNGYNGKIISFEPLSAAHAQLLRQSNGDPFWEVGPRVAIGAARAETEIHIAGNSVSSSLLPMLASHTIAAPGSDTIATEPVQIHPLDDFCENLFGSNEKLLLKIDTQGFEKEVLLGAEKTLERTLIIQIELSTVALYADQPLLPEMLQDMARRGFVLHALDPMFVDADDGRVLQFDGIFVRAQRPISQIPPEKARC